MWENRPLENREGVVGSDAHRGATNGSTFLGGGSTAVWLGRAGSGRCPGIGKGMASPSVLRQWGGSSGNTPMTEPRRSPRLSGGRPDSRQSPVASRSALAATSANTKSPARRRSSLLVGGKRSLEPRASPAQAEEDELPEEMQGLQGTPSDSPAMKKARPSEARRASRVSFGGVELLRYDKNKTGLTPAVKSPVPVASTPMPPTEVSTVTEVSEVSEVSISSNEEGFYYCDSPSNSSEDEPTKNLKDLLAEEVTDMLGFTANLTESLATKLNAGEETAPTPRLSELGNFDNTENIQQTRTSSMGSAGFRRVCGRPSIDGAQH